MSFLRAASYRGLLYDEKTPSSVNRVIDLALAYARRELGTDRIAETRDTVYKQAAAANAAAAAAAPTQSTAAAGTAAAAAPAAKADDKKAESASEKRDLPSEKSAAAAGVARLPPPVVESAAQMKAWLTEFDQHCAATKVTDLELDESRKIGYTYKCIGSGVLLLRNATDFKESITELVLEGGDADTNGACAGAMLGCKLGYSKLPLDWLNALKEKAWLDRKVDKLLQYLGLQDSS